MFYNQLEYLCHENGTTPTAFIKDVLKLSTSKITAWRNGSIPKYGILEQIANHFNVSISFLFEDGKAHNKSDLNKQEQDLLNVFKCLSDYDKGQVFGKAETLAELADERAVAAKSEPETPENPNQTIRFAPRTIEINLYDMPSSAGTGVFLGHTSCEKRKIRYTPIAEQADFAVPVSGDSMEPEFYDGDIVLVKSCPCVNQDEIGIFVISGEAYIKQFGVTCLISLNEKYAPIMLKNYETAVCLGRVLGKAELA